MPVSCLQHSRLRQLSWIMVTHVRAPSEASIGSIPLLFYTALTKIIFVGFVFIWDCFLRSAKVSQLLWLHLSLPARVSQKVGSDPSSLYFKVLPQWVIFYFSPFMESAERVGVLEASDSKIQLDVSRTQISVPWGWLYFSSIQASISSSIKWKLCSLE